MPAPKVDDKLLDSFQVRCRSKIALFIIVYPPNEAARQILIECLYNLPARVSQDSRANPQLVIVIAIAQKFIEK
jgi:hypothetical protein